MSARWFLGVVLAMLLTSCATTVVPPAPAPAEDPSILANQEVCLDLDAKGGDYYITVMVPMLGGNSPPGRKSIIADLVAVQNSVTSMLDVGGTARDHASQAIRNAAEQTARSAAAFKVHQNVDGTSLLTAFTTLTVECTKAGHKPTWFDLNALRGT